MAPTADSAEVASTLAELKTHSRGRSPRRPRQRQKEYDQAIEAWHAAESGALVPAATEQDKSLAKYAEAAKKQAEAQKGVDEILAQMHSPSGRGEDARGRGRQGPGRRQEAAPRSKGPGRRRPKKFVDRSKAMAGELLALEKTSAERSAALKKAGEAVAVTVKPVEEARAKALPLREVVREKEKAVLAARKIMVEGRVALERHKNRVRLLEAYAQRMELATQKLPMLAARAIADKRPRGCRSGSQKAANDHAAALPGRNDDIKAAELVQGASEKVARDARAALERQQKIETSVVDAFNATDAARLQLPDDSTLTEAAAILDGQGR